MKKLLLLMKSLLLSMSITAVCVSTLHCSGVRIVRASSHPWSSGALLACSPDCKTILTTGLTAGVITVHLWDAITRQQLKELKGHRAQVSSLAFSPDGNTVLTTSFDSTARLWDVKTGKSLRVFRHTSPILAGAYSPDGKTIVTGSWFGKICVWSIKKGKLLRELQAPSDGTITAVAYSPDGKTIVTGSEARRPIIISKSPYKDGRPYERDETHLVYLWNTATGRMMKGFEAHVGCINSVAWNPDGKTILTASDDATARLWDGITGKELLVLQGHTRGICSAIFSPDGKTILTGSYDKTAFLWNSSTGESIKKVIEQVDPIKSVLFSLDGSTILIGSYEKNPFWKMHTYQERKNTG